jgi:hypothetical protein
MYKERLLKEDPSPIENAYSLIHTHYTHHVELSGTILYQISLGGSMDEPLDGILFSSYLLLGR